MSLSSIVLLLQMALSLMANPNLTPAQKIQATTFANSAIAIAEQSVAVQATQVPLTTGQDTQTNLPAPVGYEYNGQGQLVLIESESTHLGNTPIANQGNSGYNISMETIFASVTMNATNCITGQRCNLGLRLLDTNGNQLNVPATVMVDNPNPSGIGWGNSGITEGNNPQGTTFYFSKASVSYLNLNKVPNQPSVSSNPFPGAISSYSYPIPYTALTDGSHVVTVTAAGTVRMINVLSSGGTSECDVQMNVLNQEIISIENKYSTDISQIGASRTNAQEAQAEEQAAYETEQSSLAQVNAQKQQLETNCGN